MPELPDRQAKYAKAIRDEIHMSLPSALRLARVVMQIADAERAEEATS